MKNLNFKYISRVILFCFGIFLAIGTLGQIISKKQNNANENIDNSLEIMVFHLNQKLNKKPLSVPFGYMKEVSIKDSCVEWHLTIDSSLFMDEEGNIDKSLDLDSKMSSLCAKKHYEFDLMFYYLIASQYQKDPISEECIKRKYSQKYICYSPISYNQYVVMLNYEDMKRIEDKCVNHYDKACSDFFSLYIEKQKDFISLFNQKSDIKMGITVYENNFIYEYTVNNEILSYINSNYGEWEKNFIQEFKTQPFYYSADKIADLYKMNIVFKVQNTKKNKYILFNVYNCPNK